MTSRERVLAAAERRAPDRVPVELASTFNAGISRVAHRNLLDFLGMTSISEIDDVPAFGTVAPDPRILDHFGVDFTHVRLRLATGRADEQIDSDTFRDEWGRVYKRTPLYIDLVSSPLTEPSIQALNDMHWPDPADASLTDGLRQDASTVRAATDKAVVARCFSGGISDIARSLRGLENFFMDLLLNERFVEALLDRVEEWLTARYFMYLNAVGDLVDVVEYGNDYGTQRGLLVSAELYRKHFKPREKRMFEVIKSRASAKLFYHSCGGIAEIIGDLIECGVDILNPVQTNAAGMDPEHLVNEFGRDLSFCGGIDVQRLLPYGTPVEIQAEVRKVASILGRFGGYIVAPCHCIQADVPPENIVAMYTALGNRG